MKRLFYLYLLLLGSAYAWEEEQAAFFEKNGYLGPFSLLRQEDAERVCEQLNHVQRMPLKQSSLNESRYWSKNHLFLTPIIVEIAKREELVGLIKLFLGPNLLLWGVELVNRSSGVMHRWHVDIEHTGWEGITAWLPLRNVALPSTIRFIPGSQRYDVIPQILGNDVNLKNDQEVLDEARKIDPHAHIITMDMQPGQFVLFAGRMWHSSVNESMATRQALIFQYCRPDAEVRIPLSYTIPTKWAVQRPWVLHVAGEEDRCGTNFLHPQP